MTDFVETVLKSCRSFYSTNVEKKVTSKSFFIASLEIWNTASFKIWNTLSFYFLCAPNISPFSKHLNYTIFRVLSLEAYTACHIHGSSKLNSSKISCHSPTSSSLSRHRLELADWSLFRMACMLQSCGPARVQMLRYLPTDVIRVLDGSSPRNLSDPSYVMLELH